MLQLSSIHLLLFLSNFTSDLGQLQLMLISAPLTPAHQQAQVRFSARQVMDGQGAPRVLRRFYSPILSSQVSMLSPLVKSRPGPKTWALRMELSNSLWEFPGDPTAVMPPQISAIPQLSFHFLMPHLKASHDGRMCFPTNPKSGFLVNHGAQTYTQL